MTSPIFELHRRSMPRRAGRKAYLFDTPGKFRRAKLHQLSAERIRSLNQKVWAASLIQKLQTNRFESA
jgi:hypothetical protein